MRPEGRNGMAVHSFTLFLLGESRVEDVDARLHAIGCLDALTGEEDGRLYAAFTRRGAGMEDAVMSARSDVEAAGIRIETVDMEDRE